MFVRSLPLSLRCSFSIFLSFHRPFSSPLALAQCIFRAEVSHFLLHISLLHRLQNIMGSISKVKTWLVTGASQGLGLAISLAVLEAGHHVIACARNPEKAEKEHPELAKKGGKWLKLDVTSPDTEQIVRDAVEKEGHVDVVVNNAGYTILGGVEDLR